MLIFIVIFMLFLTFGIFFFVNYVNNYGLEGKVKGKASPWLIREAMDKLNVGLSLATDDGFPIITNRKMNEIVFRLFGHTMMNVEETWQEILSAEEQGIFRGPSEEMTPVEGITEVLNMEEGNPAKERAFRLSDGTVYRFRKEKLEPVEGKLDLIQLSVADITRFVEARHAAEEETAHLNKQLARQQAILQEIVKLNHEQELLATKMRVHGVLGENLILSEQIAEGGSTETLPRLIRNWHTAVQNLSAVSEEDRVRPVRGSSAGEELDRVAGMIGCRIIYDGNPPLDPTMSSFFYAAIREALTNAVRHAGAKELYVKTRRQSDRYVVEITDNGRKTIDPENAARLAAGADVDILLGDGLRNLRSKLEQQGANLQLVRDEGVKLRVELPAEQG